MKFTHIRLQNFCKHKLFETDLYGMTSISGCNEVGKSTIKRAVYWVLNLKDENGKEITGIRPHDENGKEIDDLVTEVELELDTGIILRKSYYQKRNKRGEITGNQTDCFVNDIPKQSGEYAKYLAELIPSDLCVNAQSFIRMDTTKRRALLEETFGKHTTDEIVDLYPEFEPIREMLKVGTIAELKKRCNVAIKGDKNHKGLEQQIADIPTRIDEIEKQKVDIDIAEMELGRNVINEKLATNREKQNDLSKQMAEIDKASDGVLELKFKVNELVRQANEENEKTKNELKWNIDGLSADLSKIILEIHGNAQKIKKCEDRITDLQGTKDKLAEEWKKINAEAFDESTVICPTCHRELPQDEQERLLNDFNSSKAERLHKVEKDGFKAKDDIESTKIEIENLKIQNEDSEKRKNETEKSLEILEKKLSELPQTVDISDRSDIAELNQKIAEKEKQLQENNSVSEIRQKLKDEESELQSQLLEIEKQIAKSENNAAIDDRIDELRKEQWTIAQKIADEERALNYLKEFDRKKQELLTDDVNKYFEYASVKMFEPMINGEMKDVCQLCVGGEPYDRNLNFGAKMLTEIDICRDFQKKLSVELPIIIDEASSLDPWRVPEMKNQLILITRSDSKELMVSEVK